MAQRAFGWIPHKERSLEVRKSCERILQDTPLLGVSTGLMLDQTTAKKSFLWKAMEEVYKGPYPRIPQLNIGSCVSTGWAKVCALLAAIEIMFGGEPEEWPGALVAPEWIYYASRILVGKGRLGGSDGDVGAWASQGVTEHGLLFQKKYGLLDLTKYSVSRCRDFGNGRGVDQQTLEPIADEHPVLETALVNSADKAANSILNDYPVAVCSDQGFTDQRDAEGFIKPSGSWPHCMALIGVDFDFHRPGFLLDNSTWDDWVHGPTRHDNPVGTAWVDASVIDRMLRQEDSFAVSRFKGFPARNADWNL